MKRKTHGLVAVSIMGPSPDEVVAQLKYAAIQKAEVVEFRFDQMEESVQILVLSWIPNLRSMFDLKFLLTYRRASHGGEKRATDAASIKFWEKVFQHHYKALGKVEWLDWEYELLRHFDEKCGGKVKGVSIPWIKVIVSYHNFDETPDVKPLFEKFKQLLATEAFAVKVACMSHSNADNERLFRLYAASPKRMLIVIGMGEKGKPTRLKWRKFNNSLLTFARLNEKGSAPGQPTVTELLADLK